MKFCNDKKLLKDFQTLFPSLSKSECQKIEEYIQDGIYFSEVYKKNIIKSSILKRINAMLSIIDFYLHNSQSFHKYILHPKDVVALIKNFMQFERETFVAIYMNSKHKVLSSNIISIGTTDRAHLSTRDIFFYACQYNSTRFIISHNHPSGDVTPSDEDIAITKSIVSSCKIMGMHLIDHIIIGDTFFSFKEKGIL